MGPDTGALQSEGARGRVASSGKCVGNEAAGPAPGALLKPPRVWSSTSESDLSASRPELASPDTPVYRLTRGGGLCAPQLSRP